MEGMKRPRQTNCQQEPSYPEHDTVIASIRYPDLTCHLPTDVCSIEEPHNVSECRIWGKLGEPVDVNSEGVVLVPGVFDFDTGRLQ